MRDELRLGKKALPESKLHGLWRAIDEDDSGFISAGELARFMRLGKRGIGKTAARATPPGLGGLSEVYETAGAPIVLGLPPI